MKATNIEWETDGPADNLPVEVFIPFSVNEDAVADYLSDSYGFLVRGFSLDKTLSIHELYEWAKLNGVEHLPVSLQFQDGGGSYGGDTFSDMPDYPLTAEIQESGGQKYVLLL